MNHKLLEYKADKYKQKYYKLLNEIKTKVKAGKDNNSHNAKSAFKNDNPNCQWNKDTPEQRAIFEKLYGKNREKIIEWYLKRRKYRLKTIKEYSIMKNRIGKYYKSIKSDNQIHTIIRLSHKLTSEYHNLLLILTKKVNINDFGRVFHFIMKNKSDKVIYDFLSNYIKNKKYRKPYQPFCCLYEKSNVRVEAITNLILTRHTVNNIWEEHKFPNVKYLDLGCADGRKTVQIGEGLGLSKDKIYGADITDWFDMGINKNSDHLKRFNFIKLEKFKPFPIESNSFNIITLLMVLHHIPNLDQYLREINRVMEMNGVLYIREHDAFDDIDYMLIDIEHSMYARVYYKDDDFLNEYFGRYFDWLELHLLLEHYGFKKVYGTVLADSIRNKATPTRTSVAMYYKFLNLD